MADAHRPRRGAPRPRGLPVGAARRRAGRAERPRLRRRPRRRARRRRRLLPVERRALPAGRRALRAHRRRARPRARRVGAGRRVPRRDAADRAGGRPAASPSCARARWPARRRPSAPTSRRGARRSSEASSAGACGAARREQQHRGEGEPRALGWARTASTSAPGSGHPRSRRAPPRRDRPPPAAAHSFPRCGSLRRAAPQRGAENRGLQPRRRQPPAVAGHRADARGARVAGGEQRDGVVRAGLGDDARRSRSPC